MTEDARHTYALTVGYKGEVFAGYARQAGQLTVQGELENALRTILRQEIKTTCAGRTDAGVHARAQVVSFETDGAALAGRTMPAFCRSLNFLTHDDIVIHAVEERPFGFSARNDALEREYRYFIYTGTEPPLFMSKFSWFIPSDLDVAAMERASRCLIGEHDFTSFCKALSAKGVPTSRNVSEISFGHETMLGEEVLCVRVVGNAFLHNMVRIMVGTLAMVGRGQRPEEWVSHALNARDRRAAGETAPAAGLVFWSVTYD